MPLIKCIAPYRAGDAVWEPGKQEEVSDEAAAFLLRDSPGSFEVVGPPTEQPADPGVEAFTDAHSTETETGLIAPDRRARGGARR